MDSYVKALVQTHVHVDAGGRAFYQGQQLEVHSKGGKKRVLLPCSKVLYSFEDLKRAGARVDVQTLFSLAKAGAEGRWKEEIQERTERGLPSNVYIANARSIQYRLDRGQDPPPVKYVGRERKNITDVYDTVDEVVKAIAENRWRTEFKRGGRAAPRYR